MTGAGPDDPLPTGIETVTDPTPARRRPAPRRRRRRVGVVVGILVLLLLLPVAGAATWVYFQLHPRGDPGDPVVVRVEPGWGSGQIGDALADKDVIGSALVWRVFERSSNFAAGAYVLRERLGVSAAAAEMRGGPDAIPEVGVLPGLTLGEVGDRFATIKRFSKDVFLLVATDGKIRSVFQPEGVNTLEGMLWPDSYRVEPDQTEAGLTSTMVTRFDDRATALGLVPAARELGLTPYEVITVASLVQREAKLDEDRPLIAAVIYNRLRKGMPLQIDATTQYAQATGNPAYDTYEIPALPPTPISTVSAKSLQAAMHPADVPYLYYVLSDANGKHAFATTYAEHLRNVAEARRKGLL